MKKETVAKAVAMVFIGLVVMAPAPALAMHIAEGILPLGWAAGWFAVALPFVGYGLHRLNSRAREDLSFKPLVGLMAAVVFIISCLPIPVPFAGTCSHPCGTGISGILVGPAISVVITAAALVIQAVFLAHGGLSTLGADIVSMGVMGSFAGYFTFRILRSVKIGMAAAAFLAGVAADWTTYFMTSVELAAGIRGEAAFAPLFGKVLLAFVPTQLPLGILEGAITAGMVALLFRKRPDLLVKMGVIKAEEAPGKPGNGKIKAVAASLLVGAALMLAAPSVQAAKWTGVDEAVIEKFAKDHGREAKEPLLDVEQGDLLLFLFLLAGAAGGFAAGYYWRILITEKPATGAGKEEPAEGK